MNIYIFIYKYIYVSSSLLVCISDLNYSLNCELVNALKYGEFMYENQRTSNETSKLVKTNYLIIISLKFKVLMSIS